MDGITSTTLWELGLPALKQAVDEALHAAGVSFLSHVQFDEWIAGEPSLAVTWSRPAPSTPYHEPGRSVSFLLEEKDEVFLFRMFGAVWLDDWQGHVRRVRHVKPKEVQLERHNYDQLFKLRDEVTSLVVAIAKMELDKDFVESPLPLETNHSPAGTTQL